MHQCASAQLIFLDIWMQGSRLDGLELLDVIHQDHADLPVVMISGHGNIETAVSRHQKRAYDYIEKPFKSDRLCSLQSGALETQRLRSVRYGNCGRSLGRRRA